MFHRYGVVIAHVEGCAQERVIMDTITDDMATAEQSVKAWGRRHTGTDYGTSHLGFYAYADRVSGPARMPRAERCSYRIPTTRH